MPERVTLINAFEVPAAGAADFIAAWERTRDYLQQQPGYISTALQQAFAPDAEFQFVNVAHWATAEDFTKALQSSGFRRGGRRPGPVSVAPFPLPDCAHVNHVVSMEYVPLGRSGLKISPVCLGAMNFGAPGRSPWLRRG